MIACLDAEPLAEALSTPWDDRVVLVCKHVTKGSVAGVSVEQSDLTVSRGPHSPTEWRTVCFESDSVHDIEEMLAREVQGGKMEAHLRAVPNSIVQAYPSFIMSKNI